MKGSILIVDDNPNNLHLLEKLLIDNGYEVRIATNANLALKSIDIKKPELILLDIMMPEMDGYEVCQKLKSNEKTLKIPIIFLSVKDEAVDRIKAFEVGGVDYITKPFNEKEVLVRVNTHLSLYKMQNHLESEVELRTKELKENEKKIKTFNMKLEEKIKEEIAKRQEQEKVMIYQARQGVIGELMGNISHQWRQPLNLISLIVNNLEYLYENDELDKDEFKKSLLTFNQTLEKLSKTIDNFNKFFKPSDEKENFNIGDIIDDALSLIDKIEEDNININLNIEDITYYGFRNAFSQVIFYIINNAKEAIKKNCIKSCFVDINVKKEKNDILIEIMDSGGGINEDIVGKIFEPYFTTKFQSQGVGLGLYITKMIIEKHMNGKIKISNTENGAKFTIELPLA